MSSPEGPRRLMLLHRYNAYTLSFLAVSGIILFLPGLRAPLAPIRTALKDVHIGAGVLSLALLLAYVPLLAGHWLRLARRYGQQLNVVSTAAVVVGWTLSGVVLWLHRWLPTGWAAPALTLHDWLTWGAVVWGVSHSVTRWLNIRFPLPHVWTGRSRQRAFDPGEFAAPVAPPPPRWRVPLTRRNLIRAALTAAGAWVLYAGYKGLGGDGTGGSLGADPGYQPATGAAAVPAPDEGDDPGPAGMAKGTPGADAPKPRDAKPLGGGRSGRFRLYTVTEKVPAFDPKTWRLTVDGLVNTPRQYTWHELMALPRAVQVSDFHCVTGWSVLHCTWEGPQLGELLRRANAKSSARFVKFYSGDGAYTDALPLDFALQADNMVPFLLDNSPIPVGMGGPVRLIVPKMYGYKSVKWLQRIELVDENHEGFWEVRGYPNDAFLPKSSQA